ncbi:MAG: TrkH family potassium uptake protein, partial [Gammaproteobacteria bacterium]|nr:TrkH family potassium uptake protein [Gammaproteobacteria bacterium]
MLRLFPILHVLGMIVLVFGLSMLVPLLLSELTRDGAERAYDEAALITIGSGLLFYLIGRYWRRELKTRDGILLVVLTWTLLPAFAALPLLIYMPELSLADAYFEAMSGLTATGATVLSGLDELPDSINLWRAQLHWIGGLGVIVLVTAVLPLLGVGGRQMFKAETPTPMKDQKLTPRMAETAKGLWAVYVILTAACILVLWVLGMSFFDAVVHAFSILGLGGFSSHDASLGYFDSLPLEIAVGVFALIAGINFATHFAVLRGRRLNFYLHDPEIRWFLGFVLASGVILALLLWQRDIFLDFPSALRYALFNTISVATTLGFSTTDYGHWPFFAGLWLMFLCSFSTSAGSTGGGIKMMRAILLYKQVYRELQKLIHPHAQIPMRLGDSVVPNKIVYAVLAFLFIYVASIVSLSFVLS